MSRIQPDITVTHLPQPSLRDISAHPGLTISPTLNFLVTEMGRCTDTARLANLALGCERFGNLEREALTGVMAYRSLTGGIDIAKIFLGTVERMSPLPFASLPALFREACNVPSAEQARAAQILHKECPKLFMEVRENWEHWRDRSSIDQRTLLLRLYTGETFPLGRILFVALCLEEAFGNDDESTLGIAASLLDRHGRDIPEESAAVLIAPALALASRLSRAPLGLTAMKEGCDLLTIAGPAARGVTAILLQIAEQASPIVRSYAGRAVLILRPDSAAEALEMLLGKDTLRSKDELMHAMAMLAGLNTILTEEHLGVIRHILMDLYSHPSPQIVEMARDSVKRLQRPMAEKGAEKGVEI